jgi:hypothetical protein
MAKSESSGSVLLAPSPAGGQVYDLMYYIKGAAAGGICCSITHGALCPVDVVKTRVQLDPVKVCFLKSAFSVSVKNNMHCYVPERLAFSQRLIYKQLLR